MVLHRHYADLRCREASRRSSGAMEGMPMIAGGVEGGRGRGWQLREQRDLGERGL
jgi:hypothetical protein